MSLTSEIPLMSAMLPSLPRSRGLMEGFTPPFLQISSASLAVILQKSFLRKSLTVFCSDREE